MVFFCALLGWFSYKFNLFNPHNLWFSLTAVLFYGLGNIIGKRMAVFFRKQSSKVILLMAIGFLGASLFYRLNDKPEFFVNDLATPFTYVAAFGGLLMMCCFAELISRHTPKSLALAKKTFISAGKNSYIILAFHQIIVLCLGTLIIIPWGSVTRLIMWITLVILIYAINRFCPQILGRSKVGNN